MDKQGLKKQFALKHDQVLAAHKARGGEIFAGFSFEEGDPNSDGDSIRYAPGEDKDASFQDYLSFLMSYTTGCANDVFCDDTRRCPYVSKTTHKRKNGDVVLVAESVFGETAERQTDDWAGDAPEARRWIVFPMDKDPFKYLRSLLEECGCEPTTKHAEFETYAKKPYVDYAEAIKVAMANGESVAAILEGVGGALWWLQSNSSPLTGKEIQKLMSALAKVQASARKMEL